MIELNKGEKSALKRLQEDAGWEIIVRLYAEQMREWQEEEIVGQDSFQELRMLHKRQGKVEGLRSFIEKIERGTFE